MSRNQRVFVPARQAQVRIGVQRCKRVLSSCVSIVWSMTASCAYFNGMYNANAAQRAASFDLRQGRDSAARADYESSAESAEGVLKRFPDSAYRMRALYLAGTSEAMRGDCARALPRLTEFVSLTDGDMANGDVRSTDAPATVSGIGEPTATDGARAINSNTTGYAKGVSEAKRALRECALQLKIKSARDSMAAANDSATTLTVRQAVNVAAIDSAIRTLTPTHNTARFIQDLGEQLLLYHLLVDNGDAPAESQFLGAEVARDSLRAPALAYATFMGIVAQIPGSMLAPKALRAAALLEPQHGAELSARILREYPSSSVAAWMRGEDAGARPDFAATDSVLRAQWAISVRAFGDTLAKLRPAAARVQRETPFETLKPKPRTTIPDAPRAVSIDTLKSKGRPASRPNWIRQ